MRGPFSGIRTTSDELIAQGDRVAEHGTSRLRHTGEFMGIAPTGADIEILGFATYRLRDGRIVEFWELSDAMGLMQRLRALRG